jgi:hypothetical protein
MCLRVSYKEKLFFFASLKSLNKGGESGSVSQRYGSADPDPDLHQNVTIHNTELKGRTRKDYIFQK